MENQKEQMAKFTIRGRSSLGEFTTIRHIRIFHGMNSFELASKMVSYFPKDSCLQNWEDMEYSYGKYGAPSSAHGSFNREWFDKARFGKGQLALIPPYVEITRQF